MPYPSSRYITEAMSRWPPAVRGSPEPDCGGPEPGAYGGYVTKSKQPLDITRVNIYAECGLQNSKLEEWGGGPPGDMHPKVKTGSPCHFQGGQQSRAAWPRRESMDWQDPCPELGCPKHPEPGHVGGHLVRSPPKGMRHVSALGFGPRPVAEAQQVPRSSTTCCSLGAPTLRVREVSLGSGV